LALTGPLTWPGEAARPRGDQEPAFAHAGSNICLDFHGDPVRAGLVVYSDGNHHMALEECAAAFVAENLGVGDVFYATTPPGPLVAALEAGVLHIGNLALSLSPHVFIGPGPVLDAVVALGFMDSHEPFMESRGNVLLVRKGNPKGIQGAGDLMRDGVRVAISHPENEKASFQVYAETLEDLAREAGLDAAAMRDLLGDADRVLYSTAIHHREVPQLLAGGQADVAMVYYHLGLRYSRIFPDVFEFVPLGGSRDDPDPGPAQQITRYHLGLVRSGGEWGGKFRDFMASDRATDIYRSHGLRRPG